MCYVHVQISYLKTNFFYLSIKIMTRVRIILLLMNNKRSIIMYIATTCNITISSIINIKVPGSVPE